MKVSAIENPTEKVIETDIVRNGLWPGWEYILLGVEVADSEVERLRKAGALVYPWCG